MRRIPVWALLATIGIGSEIFLLGMLPECSLACSVFLGILMILVALVLPLVVFIVGLWLHSHVYRPFNDYLLKTPGDPGPNRYGPPPNQMQL